MSCCHGQPVLCLLVRPTANCSCASCMQALQRKRQNQALRMPQALGPLIFPNTSALLAGCPPSSRAHTSTYTTTSITQISHSLLVSVLLAGLLGLLAGFGVLMGVIVTVRLRAGC